MQKSNCAVHHTRLQTVGKAVQRANIPPPQSAMLWDLYLVTRELLLIPIPLRIGGSVAEWHERTGKLNDTERHRLGNRRDEH